jgi:glycosyltransferase involved in cell wall biosynthesis
MRGRGREWIRERYDWEVVASRTAGLYREIVKK